MTDRDFSRLSQYIHSQYGIKLPPAKKVMLESRLQKRLRALEMANFREYIDYTLDQKDGHGELILMMDLVTTNKTDFFREPGHFEFLVQKVLPELSERFQSGIRKPMRIWSAGCSSGEEPYTLAMVLSEYTEQAGAFYFSILATDLSTRVLEQGKNGVYDEEKVEPVPLAMKKKYLLKSKDRSKVLVRISPRLRGLVTFKRLNFMDEHYSISDVIDIIFLRNVIIYFDKQTQSGIIHRLCKHLRSGGYLFIGHSETLFGMDLPVKQIVPTIYRRL
ncbi:MAG TPA: chemotaxis protein CheR [Spirochaetales bacterium]|nr:chemotaxis protein CheR [Spirochaetales bacterium]